MHHHRRLAVVLPAAPLAAQSTLGWTQVASTGPAARYLHAMAHDGALGRTILFSGFAQNNETWAWNGASWSLAADTGPAARWLHGMVYDRLRQRVVLFGGVSSLLSPRATTRGSGMAPRGRRRASLRRRSHAAARRWCSTPRAVAW